MLYYYPIPFEELSEVAEKGIACQQPMLSEFPLSLSKASHAILVVDDLKTPRVLEQRVISPHDILNLNPYVPPKKVIAGGGYVLRDNDAGNREVLLIYRRGFWDLPKGKQDASETAEATALREVKEEVGIQQLKLLESLGVTTHGYLQLSSFHCKTTFWYAMQTPEIAFIPQAIEQIEAVAWFPLEKAIALLGFVSLRYHMVLHFQRLKSLLLNK